MIQQRITPYNMYYSSKWMHKLKPQFDLLMNYSVYLTGLLTRKKTQVHNYCQVIHLYLDLFEWDKNQ